MKTILNLFAAAAALVLASCQQTTVVVGGSGGVPNLGSISRGSSGGTRPPMMGGKSRGGPPGASHVSVLQSGRPITVSHQCEAAGRVIQFKDVPAGVRSIRCKACGTQVPCGHSGGHPGMGGRGPSGGHFGGQCNTGCDSRGKRTPYPSGPYHDPDAHDAWAKQNGAFGYSPQRKPSPPPGFQAYDPRRGMLWDGVSATVQLPPSMTGR